MGLKSAGLRVTIATSALRGSSAACLHPRTIKPADPPERESRGRGGVALQQLLQNYCCQGRFCSFCTLFGRHLDCCVSRPWHAWRDAGSSSCICTFCSAWSRAGWNCFCKSMPATLMQGLISLSESLGTLQNEVVTGVCHRLGPCINGVHFHSSEGSAPHLQRQKPLLWKAGRAGKRQTRITGRPSDVR